MKESVLLRAVMDYLTMIEKTHKLYWFRSGAGSFQTASGRYFKTGRPGCPDITVCYGGSIFLECKGDGGSQTPAQKQAQADIEAAGGKYYIVRSLGDVKAIFA